ncbi:uncharacterized protein A4U43_UnF4340 [Asparagus officinalis]|uniref:Serine-threonine/tyrosine-protein kinase catalytic domain-containing protein n=1 Tax=Asparagus officinalis TaxID=4686 RepID=A0A1R3L6V8_ASPOF|nr:uncharacterized protein A4U43_UnF4340 [Asparagus officinalis]
MLYEGVPEDRMVKLLQIALKCIYKSADARPTMSQLAEMIHSLKEEEDRKNKANTMHILCPHIVFNQGHVELGSTDIPAKDSDSSSLTWKAHQAI